MRPSITSSTPNARRKILPIIYVQPQPKSQRFLPLLIVASCGVWIFAMGALLERLPQGKTLPITSMTTKVRHHHSRDDIAANEAVPIRHVVSAEVEEPVRVLKEADSGEEEVHSTKTTQPPPPKQQFADTKSSIRIPNVLLFTHAFNLITYQPPKNDGNNRTKEQMEEQEELLVLQKNVQASIHKHPNAQVRFLTDQDCIQSLRNALGDNAPLIQYFQKEQKGMYKADICRGAALWETGGIYLDVDVGVRMPLLTEVLEANTTFATAMVHRESQHIGSFFQAFMASTPRHAILERYLQLFLEHYQGKNPVKKGPLGVILLRRAFDQVVLEAEGEVQAINDKPFDTIHKNDQYFRLGPQKVDTKHHGRIQLWQEVLYNTKLFPNVNPAPTWGTRRACHFLVVANRKFPLTVPLYSRIAGSRMCPADAAIDKAKDDSKTVAVAETKK